MILFYCLVLVSGILISYFLIKNKTVFFKTAQLSLALLNEVLSEEDEDNKAKNIQSKILPLLTNLLSVSLVFIVMIFVFYLPIFIFFGWVLNGNDSFSWEHISLFSLGTIIPFIKLKQTDSGYSELSKLLHRLALDNYNLSKWLLKKDIKANLKPLKPEFLIVTGLARSGTTSLMNYLSKMDKFSSLGYDNMPFVLSPNIWKQFYKPNKKKLHERIHQDGVKIGFNESEALEEYFFKVFLDDSYIDEYSLNQHLISDEINYEYLKYQSIIRQSDSSIYLAKNNNFLSRYKSLRSLNKEFKMVVMMREPLSHASSLLIQHKNFIKQQTKDEFVLDYMNWLGHHEFGLNQKPFVFEINPKRIEGDKNTLNYWIEIWINYYQYLASLDLSQIILFEYDNYCKYPSEHLEILLRELSVNEKIGVEKSFTPSSKSYEKYSPELLEKATGIYEDLKLKVIIQP